MGIGLLFVSATPALAENKLDCKLRTIKQNQASFKVYPDRKGKFVKAKLSDYYEVHPAKYSVSISFETISPQEILAGTENTHWIEFKMNVLCGDYDGSTVVLRTQVDVRKPLLFDFKEAGEFGINLSCVQIEG